MLIFYFLAFILFFYLKTKSKNITTIKFTYFHSLIISQLHTFLITIISVQGRINLPFLSVFLKIFPLSVLVCTKASLFAFVWNLTVLWLFIVLESLFYIGCLLWRILCWVEIVFTVLK